MLKSFKNKYEYNTLVPLLILLSIIGLLNTIQFYNFHTNETGIVKFLNILGAKMLYSWCYLLLIVPVFYTQLGYKSRLNKLVTSFTALLIFLFLHQAVGLLGDVELLGKSGPESLFDLLINNKSVWIDITLFILILLLYYFINFNELINKKAVEQSKLELDLIKAKLDELRVKIQPGILFNTLKNIDELLEAEFYEKAGNKLSLLSDFLRTIIYDTDKKYSSVSEEVTFVQLFAEVCSGSKEKDFKLTVDSDKEAGKFIIPGFTLQPVVQELVELSENKTENLRIMLKLIMENDRLKILFETNTGIPEKSYKESSIFGYINDRMKKEYENDYEITFNEKDGSIFSISLYLPKLS